MSKKVLIIEDDKEIAMALSKAIQVSGHESMHAIHGREALSMLESDFQLPDLMIVDIMMPVLNGIEFRKLQLASDKLKHIPIIFLTASKMDRDELMKLSPYESLVKPIDLDDFLKILENFFFTH